MRTKLLHLTRRLIGATIAGTSLAMIYQLAPYRHMKPTITLLIFFFLLATLAGILILTPKDEPTVKQTVSVEVNRDALEAYHQLMNSFQNERGNLTPHTRRQILNTLDAMETSIAISTLNDYRRNHHAA